MEKKNNSKRIYDTLKEMYPNARCELNYTTSFELCCATILSAQATDVSVNKVTKVLFSKFGQPRDLAKASFEEVKEIIKIIGLSNAKANNIIKFSIELEKRFNGIVPNNYNDLITLPGIGRKTANVVLSEAFNIPRIAVDTHCARVANRLLLSDSTSVLVIENDLMQLFPESDWHDVHLKLLFFGRYFCKAKNPKCQECPFIDICKQNKI